MRVTFGLCNCQVSVGIYESHSCQLLLLVDVIVLNNTQAIYPQILYTKCLQQRHAAEYYLGQQCTVSWKSKCVWSADPIDVSGNRLARLRISTPYVTHCYVLVAERCAALNNQTVLLDVDQQEVRRTLECCPRIGYSVTCASVIAIAVTSPLLNRLQVHPVLLQLLVCLQ